MEENLLGYYKKYSFSVFTVAALRGNSRLDFKAGHPTYQNISLLFYTICSIFTRNN